VQLNQPTHASTSAVGPNQANDAATLSHTGGGAPRQSPSRVPSPIHTLLGDEEFDQVQISDWDEEAEEEEAAAEEEGLAIVQQEIEKLWQEQESILRRQAAVQRTEAHRKNINRERARLTKMQYTLDILH
jgi:hypothetical protein